MPLDSAMPAVTAIGPPPPPLPPASASAPPLATFRYVVFLLLVFNSALVESVSFAYLGSIFCAYVTGTFIILGLELVRANAGGGGGGDAIAPSAVALGGFAVGSFAAGATLECARQRRAPVLRSVHALLLLEAPLLVAAAAVAAEMELDQLPGQLTAVALLSLAMGFQMSAVSALSVPFLSLPLATGAFHALWSDNPFRKDSRERTARRLSLLLVLVLGAAVGASISQSAPWRTLAASAGLVGAVLAAIEVALRVHGCTARRRANGVEEPSTKTVAVMSVGQP